jgi:sugar phosphate isomerase/epimerase
MSCHISTGCFQTRDLDKIVALACKNGFDLELSSSLSFSPSMLRPILQAKSRVGFLIHNYFPPPAVPFVLNLASSDPETHSRSVNFCLEAISLCADIGVPCYSVHAGFAMEMSPIMLGKPRLQGDACATGAIDRGKAFQTFVETMHKLAEHAAEKRVILLVENNALAVENIAADGTFPMLLADVDEIKLFFNSLCLPGVGLLLDVGHAKVSAETLHVQPQTYFDELKPFIRCLHLSDNDGRRDSNRPIGSASWFVPYLKRFQHAVMVVEVYRCSLAEILKQRDLVMNLLD